MSVTVIYILMLHMLHSVICVIVLYYDIKIGLFIMFKIVNTQL